MTKLGMRSILDNCAEEARRAKRIVRMTISLVIFLTLGVPTTILLTSCGPTPEEQVEIDRGREIFLNGEMMDILVSKKPLHVVDDGTRYAIYPMRHNPKLSAFEMICVRQYRDHVYLGGCYLGGDDFANVDHVALYGSAEWYQIWNKLRPWPGQPTEAPDKEDETHSDNRLSDEAFDDRITSYYDINPAQGSLRSNPNWRRVLGASPLDECCDPFQDDGSNCAIAAR